MRRHDLVALCAALAALPAAAQEAVSLARQGKQPRVAVGDSGLVAIVYGQGNQIFCRTSKDGGVSYAEETRVGEVEGLMLGMRRGPQVAAAAGSSLVVTAIGRGHGNLVSWRSADGGRNWVGPTTVNDRASSAREGLHGVAAGGGGSVHVVWLDLRDARTKVFGARSPDQGRTWDSNRLVYASPEGTVCECCQPTVAANDHGEVAVMWRNSLAGARDMYLARSSDGGRTFAEPQKLGKGSWPLKGCPMDGGGVAVTAESVATVWRREEVVYAAAAGEEEKPLARGRNAGVAFGPDGITTAWQTPEGAIVLKRSGAEPVSVGRGRFAHLGAAPDGRGPVVLAWEDPELGAMVLPVASRRAQRTSDASMTTPRTSRIAETTRLKSVSGTRRSSRQPVMSLGVKLSTGRNDVIDDYDATVLDPTMQPGTGAFQPAGTPSKPPNQKTEVTLRKSVLPWSERSPNSAVPRWNATWTVPNGGL